MSVKANALANYAGQLYTTLIGIVVYPFYLAWMGEEAYGLVGFFIVLQAWLNLLDMGMSPTLARETARAATHQGDQWQLLRRLVRSLEIVFLGLAVVMVVSIVLGSDWIATNWLEVKTLSRDEVAWCIVLMGYMIGMRWLASLYRSGIQGLERQVSLNVANVVIATFKFVGVLLILQFVSTRPSAYFEYQIAIALLELVVLGVMFYRLLGGREQWQGFSWSVLRPVLPFAGGVAYTAGIWILMTQLDKLLLSSFLPLSEYGYFTLVVVVANAIMTLTMPISRALMPRMTGLLASQEEAQMLRLYRRASQFIAATLLPVAGMVALYGGQLLYAWTGNMEAARWGAPILLWYALGNGLLAIGAFQYYLQYAHGQLRLHVIYNTVSVLIVVPVVVVAAWQWQAIGVAVAWCGFRLLSFLLWTPFVHARFAPGIHREWMTRDILPCAAATALMLLFYQWLGLSLWTLPRPWIFVSLMSMGIAILLVNAVVSSVGRDMIIRRLQERKHARATH
ncbi:lipopolysaccharide biosynthesis protein [Kushneria sp. Sum13]|uniref:lipopolysaccharide biosynthesis protein n=1 Tax=Kushneria sp. Sum13 TaxID=3459196 RepID=UPI004045C474